MYNYIPLDQVLFIDIETVSDRATLSDAPELLRKLWGLKAGRFPATRDQEMTEELSAAMYEEKAAIYAEFGKVVVISAGFLYLREGEWHLRTKSFMDASEKDLLMNFSQLLNESADKFPGNFYLCGHNVKEFDIPYLCRRMIINGLSLPGLLDFSGRKPWETPLLDTMEMWKFGDYKSYTSLELLAHVLDIPGPKDDISGADVGRVYWQEKDIRRIALYCEKDVATVAQVMMRYQGKDLIPDTRMSSAT